MPSFYYFYLFTILLSLLFRAFYPLNFLCISVTTRAIY